jgi:pimeloyl-ACP methyl ester carboxylesterase
VARHHQISSADCRLNVWTIGPEDGEPFVLLHGMKDHSGGLVHIAQAFPGCRVIIPDLRGHGRSDHPGCYTMSYFLSDLMQVFEYFDVKKSTLLGHSLGGHIVCWFAALYPDLVEKLIIVDGFGPPRSREGDDQQVFLQRHRQQVAMLKSLNSAGRSMSGFAEALNRFQQHNSKLDHVIASRIVEEGIRELEGGRVTWRWDPRVDMVWSTFSHTDSEGLYQQIRCPTLVITGSEGLAYWSFKNNRLKDEQAWYKSELNRRVTLFEDATHVEINGAGHMVQFDKPSELIATVSDFLQA